MTARVALVGIGPHARHIYYPYLEHRAASLELVVELESARPGVEKFLSSRTVTPHRVLYLDDEGQRAPERIAPAAAAAIAAARVDRVIVATEPKAHRAYLEHCISGGIPVLTDKPVTAPLGLRTSVRAAGRVFRDVVELVERIRARPGSRVLVQCQRRNHPGYRYVFAAIQSVIEDYGVPITHVSIHHSDGMWNMPDEYLDRENHPYKYGYGKLMHSGYHFVDLLADLIKLNRIHPGKRPDSLTIYSQASGPADHQTVFSNEDYRRFFGAEAAHRFRRRTAGVDLGGYGELDSYSQIQLSRRGKVITTAQLSLLQSGLSQRAWAALPEDTYRGNGRIRHESVTIHLGPLACLQVHAYQSRQHFECPADAYDAGDHNHFDVYVFRNSNLIGGPAFERLSFGAPADEERPEPRLGNNDHAKLATLDELIHGLPSGNELESHLLTNRLIAEISANHARQAAGETPVGHVDLESPC